MANPFKQLTHGGTLDVAEIQFHTSFNYMFPLLEKSGMFAAARREHTGRAAITRHRDGG